MHNNPIPWSNNRERVDLIFYPLNIIFRSHYTGFHTTQPGIINPLLGGIFFQGDLIFQGNVVAEEQNVQPLVQRFPGLPGGVAPGYGYDGQV